MNACFLQVEKEVVILRQLHHENLVGYLFVADQGSKISIVMEWAGDSLREHRTVTQPKQYCEAVARHMVYQLTHALVYLHQKVRRSTCGVAVGDCLVRQ
jgi:serine/threonine protein kinase